MDILFSKKKLFDIKADLIIFPVFKNERNEIFNKFNIERVINGRYKELLFTNLKIKNQLKNILFVGMGDKNKLTNEKIRELAGLTIYEIKKHKIQKIATNLWIEDEYSVRAQIEGFLLAYYEFLKLKTNKEKQKLKLIIVSHPKYKKIIRETEIIINNVNFVREITNLPSNIATPSYFEKLAKEIVKKNKNMKIRIFDKNDLKTMGLNAFYAVAKGSDEPAKMIVIEYKNDKDKKPIALVGKGVTFDSGGISLKPQATPLSKIEEMKYDKAGACAVLGVLKLASELNLKVNLIGVLGLTENLPSSKSYKPGDILTTFNGKTVEVISTDAEGRLILADCISYSLKYKPRLIIDIATLTGACIISLGHYATGLMGNNEKYIILMKRAGEISGEKVWELPLWDEYREQIKSKNADIKNVGGGDAATITAGLFLKEFVKETSWVHLDIAGTAYNVKNKSYYDEKATGVGVRLIFNFLKILKREEA